MFIKNLYSLLSVENDGGREMTICVGFIPNDKTVMIMQDGEVTNGRTGIPYTVKKMQRYDDKFFIGYLKSRELSGLLDIILQGADLNKIKNYDDMKKEIEKARHKVWKSEALAVLKQHGVNSLEALTSTVIDEETEKEIDLKPEVKNVLLNTITDKSFLQMGLMVGYFFDKPGISYMSVAGALRGSVIGPKEFYVDGVAGEGITMKMKKMVAEYQWKPGIDNVDALDILVKAGNGASEYSGVGGPFSIIMMGEDKKVKELDERKLNMVMDIDRLNELSAGGFIPAYCDALTDLADHKVSADQLYDKLSKLDVGYEFKHKFKNS